MQLFEQVTTVVSDAVSTTRICIVAKNVESKSLGEAASRPAVEESSQLIAKIHAEVASVGLRKKDTEAREKTVLVQEAGELTWLARGDVLLASS